MDSPISFSEADLYFEDPKCIVNSFHSMQCHRQAE